MTRRRDATTVGSPGGRDTATRASGLANAARALACVLLATVPVAVEAADPRLQSSLAAVPALIPPQLDSEQRAGYRLVFDALRAERWIDAGLALDAMKPGPLHAIARAELLTARGSPRASVDALVKQLGDAPELPEAVQIAALATTRGATDLPPLPALRKLVWIDGAPVRARAHTTRSDLISSDLGVRIEPLIKSDDAAGAEALFNATSGLSPDATTEWQQKIAWIYFLAGNDVQAGRLAALAAAGTGDWSVQAAWVGALAAWRQGDYAAAADGFATVAARASDIDMRAAGLYWAARADLRCARPDRVETRLKNAAVQAETFYGQLARQALGIREIAAPGPSRLAGDEWQALARRPNLRVAAALVEVGETKLADTVIRQQARIGDPADFPALIRLTAALDLAGTLVWLSHNAPTGASPPVEARYPQPAWTPDGGWRVERALIYAHTLQESRFRTDVVSPAGAYGLMQVRPGAATDIARRQGRNFDRAALSRPGANMEVGQSYLEQLRDQPCTGGLLPKVIAAYNAGPQPVSLWNLGARDGGDPLLYIESIPYWETRGYVTTVLRNYWFYERQGGRAASPSRTALAQGLWPRFPGLPGASSVRLSAATPSIAAPQSAAPATRRVPDAMSATTSAGGAWHGGNFTLPGTGAR